MEAREGRVGGGELDVVLASLAEGLRVLTVLLQPWLPATSSGCSRRSVVPAPTTRSRPRSSARGASASRRRSSRCFPAAAGAPRAIDSHTHLDSCEPPNDELLAAARAAGVRRILTVGMDAELPLGHDGGRALPGGLPGGRPSPEPRRGLRRPRDGPAAVVRRARALPGDRRDRTGPLSRPRAEGRSAARVRGADRAGARARQAARHPLARGGGRHHRHAARPRRRRAGDPPLLLDAGPPRVPGAAALVDLVRGERHLSERGRSRGGRRAAGRAPARGDRRAAT